MTQPPHSVPSAPVGDSHRGEPVDRLRWVEGAIVSIQGQISALQSSIARLDDRVKRAESDGDRRERTQAAAGEQLAAMQQAINLAREDMSGVRDSIDRLAIAMESLRTEVAADKPLVSLNDGKGVFIKLLGAAALALTGAGAAWFLGHGGS